MTPSPADPVRLMLVDDQRPFVDSLVALLAHDDRVEIVGVADTAEQARTLAATLPVDVALVDLMLAGADGAELTRDLLTLRPGLRVVLVSGRSEHELRQRAARAGAAAYLQKGSLGAEVADVVLDVHRA